VFGQFLLEGDIAFELEWSIDLWVHMKGDTSPLALTVHRPNHESNLRGHGDVVEAINQILL
jgi:hypothetical protein